MNNRSKNNSESKLCCFGYVDYIVLASTLAIALAEELNSQDINILASFFDVLADELVLIESVMSCSSENGEDEFIPPAPDAPTARTSKSKYKNNPKGKTRIKKVIKRKIKKVKTLNS